MSTLVSLATRFLSKEQLRKFALWALDSLEEQLDPEAKARLEKYRLDRAQLEADTQRGLAEIEALRKSQTEVALQREAEQQRLARNEASLKQLQQEVKQIDEQPNKVDTLSPDDVLRGDLRRHGS
jgi:chromosome segregation ATPase